MPKTTWHLESEVFLNEVKNRLENAPYGRMSHIARMCETDQANICQYLKKKRQPMLWLAVRLANQLEIDLSKIQEKCRLARKNIPVLGKKVKP